MESTAPMSNKRPIAIPAFPPALIPPSELLAALVELEVADAAVAEAADAIEGVEVERAVEAAKSAMELAMVVEGALMAVGSSLDDEISAMDEVGIAVSLTIGTTEEEGATTTGATELAFVADFVAATTGAGAVVFTAMGVVVVGASSPTVLYPAMGPSKVAEAVT